MRWLALISILLFAFAADAQIGGRPGVSGGPRGDRSQAGAAGGQVGGGAGATGGPAGPRCSGTDAICSTFRLVVTACSEMREDDGSGTLIVDAAFTDPDDCQVTSLDSQGLNLRAVDATTVRTMHFDGSLACAADGLCTAQWISAVTAEITTGSRDWIFFETAAGLDVCLTELNGTGDAITIEAAAGIATTIKSWTIDLYEKFQMTYNGTTGDCIVTVDPMAGEFGLGLTASATDNGTTGLLVTDFKLNNANDRVDSVVNFFRADAGAL